MMRKLAAVLIMAGATLAAAGGANAQPGSETAPAAPAPASASGPDVTVQGPERLVCRSLQRTATRMRSNRVCRTVREWDEARAGRTQDEELAEAADTLDMLGADDISTGCGDNALSLTPDTPLGPR